ncbi:MAG TPA: PAS domain S-box protein, partial [Chroococcales cyanobacterium]
MQSLSEWQAPGRHFKQSDLRRWYIKDVANVRPWHCNMHLNLRLSQQGFLLFGIALVMELVFVTVLWTSLQNAEAEIAEANRIHDIVRHLTKLSTVIQNASMGLVMTIVSPREVSYESYTNLVNQIPEEIRQLRAIVKDNVEQAPFKRLEHTCNLSYPIMELARQTYVENDVPRHKQYLMQLRADSDSAMRQVDEILEKYRRMEDIGLRKQEASRHSVKVLLAVGLVLHVVFGTIFAVLFITGITRRLKILTDNTLLVAAGQPLKQPVGGNDEITTVDRAFRKMNEALQEAKHKEQAIVENALDVICSIDEDGRFSEVSPASLSLWGYRPDELLGMRYAELLDPSHRNKNQLLGNESHKTSRTAFENRVQRKDGELVEMLWSAQWSPREKSWFCVAHDITARKRAEQLRRDFVAMISHDLRTPLTSVGLTLDLLSAGACGDLPDRAVQNVNDADRNLSYVMTLINGLLDVEKMNAGKLEMRFSETSIADVLQRGIDAVLPLAERD